MSPPPPPLTPRCMKGSDLIRTMPRCVLAAVKGGDVPAGQGVLVRKAVGEVSPCGARDLRHRRSALGKKEAMISGTDSSIVQRSRHSCG